MQQEFNFLCENALMFAEMQFQILDFLIVKNTSVIYLYSNKKYVAIRRTAS